MGCLRMKVTVLPVPTFAVQVNLNAQLVATPVPKPVLAITLAPKPKVTTAPVPNAKLEVAPLPNPTVTLAEVCSVSGGTIMVLAATDGRLRFNTGDYWTLDPSQEEDSE